MTVPYSFGSATSAIPLSQLDSNFNTPITLGNTAIQLGNTVTTLNNMTLANVTITSGTVNVSFSNANAVVYTSSSNVATTSTALTFDGTNLLVGASSVLNPVSNYRTIQLTGTSGAIFDLGQTATAYGRISADSTGLNLEGLGNVVTTFRLNGSEQMRLTSTGLGIGTSSPSNPLTVNKDGAAGVLIRTSDTNYSSLNLGSWISGGVTYISSDKAGTGSYLPLTFYTNGSERMRLDTSGNLGLGVTPNTSWATLKTIQIGNAGFSGYLGGNYSSSNAYYDGATWRYITANKATLYQQSSGGYDGLHKWFISVGTPSIGADTAFTQAMTLDASGNLLVGCTSLPSSSVKGSAFLFDANQGRLYVSANSTAARDLAYWINPNGVVGTITTSGTSTAYNTSSDYRLKHDIAPMTGALAKVAALKPVTYKWNADNSDGEGFIAHELAEVCPHAVTGEKDATRIEQYEISPAVPATFDEDGNELTPAVEAVMGEREVPAYQGIDTSFLVATLTAAIKEQQELITQLQADVAALKGAKA